MYLLGDKYKISVDKDTQNVSVNVTISSEELLLNVYHQAEVGAGPLVWIVDASYKYIVEGIPLFPVKVICANTQRGHVVGYGVISKANTECHKFVLDSLKREVEHVVNEWLDREEAAKMAADFS